MFEEGEVWEQLVSWVEGWLKRRGLILGSTHKLGALGLASSVNIPYNGPVLEMFLLGWHQGLLL